MARLDGHPNWDYVISVRSEDIRAWDEQLRRERKPNYGYPVKVTRVTQLAFEWWASENPRPHKHGIGCGWCSPSKPPTAYTAWSTVRHTHISTDRCFNCGGNWDDEPHRRWPVQKPRPLAYSAECHPYDRQRCLLCGHAYAHGVFPIFLPKPEGIDRWSL